MSVRPAAVIAATTLVASGSAFGQTPYRLPPKEVVKLVDAAPPPSATASPRPAAIAMAKYEANPPTELLARPFVGLPGVRVDPDLAAERRTTRFTSITIR